MVDSSHVLHVALVVVVTIHHWPSEKSLIDEAGILIAAVQPVECAGTTAAALFQRLHVVPTNRLNGMTSESITS